MICVKNLDILGISSHNQDMFFLWYYLHIDYEGGEVIKPYQKSPLIIWNYIVLETVNVWTLKSLWIHFFSIPVLSRLHIINSSFQLAHWLQQSNGEPESTAFSNPKGFTISSRKHGLVFLQ